MCLVRFQEQREIDLSALDDVKTTRRKSFPGGRRRRKDFLDQGGWNNDKPRSHLFHEQLCVAATQRRHPGGHAPAKIPNKTWLDEIDRAEFHFRSQIVARLS